MRKKYWKTISIEINNICHKNCWFCYVKKSRNIFPIYKYEIILKIGRKRGYKYLTLGGGEPLLLKNVEKYVNLGKKYGYIVSLTTNYPEKTLKIDLNVDMLTISINSLSLENLRILEELAKKYDVGVNLLIDRPIIAVSLPFLVDLLYKKGAKYVFLLALKYFDFSFIWKYQKQILWAILHGGIPDESLALLLGLKDRCERGRKFISVSYRNGYVLFKPCSFSIEAIKLKNNFEKGFEVVENRNYYKKCPHMRI